METLDKKAKGPKKDKKAKKETSVTTGRLMTKGNVRQRTSNAKPLGQLTEVIGQGAYYELYSERNFAGTARILLKGWFAENNPDEDAFDFRLTCDLNISKELRSADSEEEFNAILDSLEHSNCLLDVVQATTSKGEKMFDPKGEPIMDDVYYLSFDNNDVDMSATRRTSSGVVKEVVKEKKAFSITKAIGGQY